MPQTKEDIKKAIYKLSDELDEAKTEFYNDYHLATDENQKNLFKTLSEHYEDLSIKVYKIIK